MGQLLKVQLTVSTEMDVSKTFFAIGCIGLGLVIGHLFDYPFIGGAIGMIITLSATRNGYLGD